MSRFFCVLAYRGVLTLRSLTEPVRDTLASMDLISVAGNSQALDGGAMFGNCPKALWTRWYPADEQNRIPLACRCLLVRERSGRLVLLETGIGSFFPPKLRDRFGVRESEHVLLDNLANLGIAPSDIDVIVLSHLHFDHAGGLLTTWKPDTPAKLVFTNASYVVGARAFARALAPHPRDRASFIPELQGLLQQTGRLELVEGHRSKTLGDGYWMSYSDGHTPGLMLTRVEGASRGPITFLGDLIPGAAWVNLPITMGYDRYPERLIDEKQVMLERLYNAREWLFFTHDHKVAACRLGRDDRGRFVATEHLDKLD